MIPQESDPKESDPTAESAPVRRGRTAVAVAAVLAALAGMNLWGLVRDQQARRVEHRAAAMVAAARAGMVNLTSIDYQRVDQDIQRILDSSTDAFRDDFARNAASFADAARQAQSTSVGTVSEAGLESDGDGASDGRVLVAMTVMTSNRGVPEKQPRNWRTRVTVTDSGGAFKVAAVEFIP